MEDLLSRYKIENEIGRGAFSIVKLATDRKTKEQVAIKIIPKKNIGKDHEKNLRMEVAILQKVSHPNIIALKEMVETQTMVFLVMELVTGGELFDRIVEKGCYTEKDAASLVRQVCSAVEYLHSKNIVHRDLKPENLLLKSTSGTEEVKMADFGLSKIIGEEMMMQTACGTPGYVAPEVLTATGYDKEVDMWSTGVITYILLCGFPPFYNEDVPKLFESIMNADFTYPSDYWKDISKEAKDFINKLLVVNPAERMTATKALQHPWLTGKASSGELKNVTNKMAQYVEKRKIETRQSWADLNDTTI